MVNIGCRGKWAAPSLFLDGTSCPKRAYFINQLAYIGIARVGHHR